MKNLKNKNKAIGLGLILGLTLSSGYINATDTTTTPETVANSQPNPSKVKSKPTKHTFTLSASYGELEYSFSNSYKDEILRGLTPAGYLSASQYSYINDAYTTNKLSYRNPIGAKNATHYWCKKCYSSRV